MRKVIVLCGIPGSGKSTYLKRFGNALVCSADHFFTNDGVYTFNPSKLGAAHNSCKTKFFNWVEGIEDREFDTVIVDNTNLRESEREFYIDMAHSKGIHTEIHCLPCDVEVSKKRNIHGVPADKIESMAKRMDLAFGTIFKVSEFDRYNYMNIGEISKKDVGME